MFFQHNVHLCYQIIFQTKVDNSVSVNSQKERKEYGAAITKGMNDGWLRPVIAREYSMDEIQLAHEHLMKRHGHLGKLILKVF